jgi:hypothetical protein
MVMVMGHGHGKTRGGEVVMRNKTRQDKTILAAALLRAFGL